MFFLNRPLSDAGLRFVCVCDAAMGVACRECLAWGAAHVCADSGLQVAKCAAGALLG